MHWRQYREGFVLADDDGVIFTPEKHLEDVMITAHGIWETERKQAEKIITGITLCEQLHFDEYMAKRLKDSDYTFRTHLRGLGAALEE
ncbi:MAG: hypothetical protein ACYC21_09940 [Eubacteriales bacterium]